jgi:hypothetical protein
MSPVDAYSEFLKKDLGSLIEDLKLEEIQKHFLRSRSLDQVLWRGSRRLSWLELKTPGSLNDLTIRGIGE